MIIIHIDKEDDTKVFRHCYTGIKGYFLYNPTRDVIDFTLKEHPMDTVMLIGHGSRDGLFGYEPNTMAIDKDNANLLFDRIVIGVWCFAAEFADIHNLRGFFTSMFISNMQEALMFNMYKNLHEEDLPEENERFAKEINEMIRTNAPVCRWVELLQEGCHRNIPFVRFNYEALYTNVDSDTIITDYQ